MEQKEQILLAAIKLFADKGLDGVSIREIAAEAKVHFSNIRHHFGDKEDLYRACISEHGNVRLSIAQKYLADNPKSSEDARLRLEFALNEVFERHSENPALSRLLLREVETETDRSDKVLKKTMLEMTKIHKMFVEKCIEKKWLCADLDANFLVVTLMGVLHHYMRTEGTRSRLHGAPRLSDKAYRNSLVSNILVLFFDKNLHKAR